MTATRSALIGLLCLVFLGAGGFAFAQSTPQPDADSTETQSGVGHDGAADGDAIDTLTRTSLIESLQALVGESIDLAAWNALAQRAETVIDRNQASSAAFENLRSELVGYRNEFTGIREENSARIRTIKTQIDRLGPAPESGAEPESVALTRASLNRRLDQLMAPVIAAEAAFGITDGLISEIDALQRSRQADAFVRRDPSPLNPANWAEAIRNLNRHFGALGEEAAAAISNEVTRASAAQKAPRLIAMILAGLYLLLRGRSLARQFGAYMRRFGGAGSGVWDFVISFGRIGIPYAGIVLIVNALSLSGLPGYRLETLLNAVPTWSMVIFGVIWLRDRLFSPQAFEDGIRLAPRRRLPEVMLMITLLAFTMVLADALLNVVQLERMDDASKAVLAFPILVMGSLFLFRLAAILGHGSDVPQPELEEGQDAPERGYGPLLPGLCWAAKVVAVLTPIAAGLGYTEAGLRTLFPTIWTLALFGAVVALHVFLTKFYAWATGRGAGAKESLAPAIAGIVLVLAAVPLVALIWGVRLSDLQELWTRFLEGVMIGETRISPTDFLAFVAIFGVGYMATRLLQGALRNNLLPKTSLDMGGQTAIVSGTGYVGIFLAALVAISTTGLDLSSLAIVAGALSVGIGFGLQTIVSNFVSGIILLVERPVSEGDWIEVGDQMGIVKNISVRATRIETFDRTDVIVPNSDLISGRVTNYTRNPIGRVIVPVGVAYGTDTHKVEAILREIAEAHPMALARPAPFVVFQGFGADSLDFEVRVIIRDVNWGLTVRTELNHAIAERFTAEGIEIPFAQRDVWLRNPEALTRPQADPSPAPGG